MGVENIDSVVAKFGQAGVINGETLRSYLIENIDYNFNDDKKAALKLFLQLMGEL